MKKILSLFLTLIIVLNLSPAFAASSKDDSYKQAGEILENLNILEGSGSEGLMLDEYLKRQDMVVLISRLYNEEKKAKDFRTKDTFKDITNSFYEPYIYWAVDKGLIVGTGQNNFGFHTSENEYYVKVQQFQNLLLRALNYGSEIESYGAVPNMAKNLGLMEGISVDPDEFATRGLIAAMTLNALNLNAKGSSMTLAQQLDLDVPIAFDVEATPSTYKDTLVFEGVAKGADELEVSLDPISSDISSGKKFYNIDLKEDGRFEIEIENLESGKYEYTFFSGNSSTGTDTVTIPELPFELSDVEANNLKEITLDFTQAVDKDTSQFTSNYFTDAGTIKSVRLENNNKTVVLTLNETMKNQNTYTVSINRLKSDKDSEINIRDREFTVFDNEIPKVEEVTQLGNKGLKIQVSEPIKNARSADFEIDGKSISASIDTTGNIITLKYYSSYYAPDEGKHTLSVSGLVDYANYKALDEEIIFEIFEDDEPPKIVDIRATMEEAIIQFDEDIDPSSVKRTNFYYKTGSSKRYPSDVDVVNDTVILDYSSRNLPTYDITIYIESIEDYSNNTLRNEEVEVEPVLDRTNPEVIGLTVAEDGKSITVYYSKNVDAKNRSHYTIRDEEDNRIYVQNVKGSGREYRINLRNPLPAGTNTISIEDVEDTTNLENKLVGFTQDIYMEDVEVPEIISYSGNDNQITLLFNKDMDPITVEEHSNYLFEFNGKYRYLPSGTEFHQLYDEKTYVITLPEEIDGKEVEIGKSRNIEKIEIRGLKGTNGALVDPTTLTFDGTTEGQAIAKSAELIEPDTIIVTFDQPILDASRSDFSISGESIDRVRVDGSKEVEIILDNDQTSIDNKLNIKNKNSIETFLDAGAKKDSIDIIDSIKPRIDADSGRLSTSGRRTIYLPFTEELEGRVASLFGSDLIVEVVGGEILDTSQYSTSLSNKTEIKITVNSSVDAPDGFYVRLVDEPRYIMDTSGNIVEYDEYDYSTK